MTRTIPRPFRSPRSRLSAGVNDGGRRFLQELPTQRRKHYARVNTSITHRPYSWRPAGRLSSRRRGATAIRGRIVRRRLLVRRLRARTGRGADAGGMSSGPEAGRPPVHASFRDSSTPPTTICRSSPRSRAWTGSSERGRSFAPTRSSRSAVTRPTGIAARTRNRSAASPSTARRWRTS